MQIELPARAIKLLQEILPELNTAYNEIGDIYRNDHDSIYYHNDSTINEVLLPEKFSTLNRRTLKKASELKQLLHM